jgi:hypothetical protein
MRDFAIVMDRAPLQISANGDTSSVIGGLN